MPPYVDGELKPDYLRRGRDGAIYSIHAPGVSAVVLPAFALAGYPGAVLTLVAAWRARDAGGLARRHAISPAASTAASVATAGVGLSVPFFFQTFTIYPDGPAAVGVAVVVWLALIRPGALTWQRALACGALLGVLPWLHTRYAAIAGPLGLIVAGRLLWPREASLLARARPCAGRARGCPRWSASSRGSRCSRPSMARGIRARPTDTRPTCGGRASRTASRDCCSISSSACCRTRRSTWSHSPGLPRCGGATAG